MKRIIILSMISLILLSAMCTGKKQIEYIPIKPETPVISDDIPYAGARSSSYGISPFPSAQGWERAMKTMSGHFEGAHPCGIWIVGEMGSDTDCRLFFPSDGNQYDHILFIDSDRHEPFLSHFDEAGIQVFLQVEPASADMKTLIDLVLNRYKHHPCVVGFGIDVEWHREAEQPGWGVPASDEMAQQWETWVKAHNPEYTLFLKHWDRNWMPPAFRGDLLFISDSQGFASFDDMADEFINYWAAHFAPNSVGFQYGYGDDRSWWNQLSDPPAEIGAVLAEGVDQPCSLFWVDFTLGEVLPVTSNQE